MIRLSTFLFVFNKLFTSGLSSNNFSECGLQEISPNLDYIKPTDDQRNNGIDTELAVEHSWPWHVFVLAYNATSSQMKCAGSLLSETTVVTSPRCIFDGVNTTAENITLYIGYHSFGETIIANTTTKRRVSKYKIITKNRTSVAILKFADKVKRTKSISPLCFAKKSATPQQLCYVTGWGLSDGKFERPTTGNAFKQSKFSVVPNEDCKEKMRMATMMTRMIVPVNPIGLSELQMCAESSTGISCSSGDMGGPLQCLVDGKWELQGILDVRRRYTCFANSPQIFTRVAPFSEDIEKLL